MNGLNLNKTISCTTIASFVLSSLLFFPVTTDTAGVHASSSSVFLDAATLARGYTVSAFEDQFRLGILPDLFGSDHVLVDVKDITEEPLPLPPHQIRVSPIFLYDITNAPKQALSSPLPLSIEVADNPLPHKQIAYWDKEQWVWKSLPTRFDEKTNRVYANIPFPFSIVTVFAEELHITQEIKENFDHQLQAASILVYDPENNSVLYEKDAQLKRSIASLSKLMTALVFLDHNPGWDVPVAMKKSDEVGGARLKTTIGEQYTVKDLFYAAMIGSKNNAVMALVRSTGLTPTQFSELMNQKASSLEMNSTIFFEPTGLSASNQSTAKDIAILLEQAYSHPVISDILTMPAYTVSPLNADRYVYVATTNDLLHDAYPIVVAKTGYTLEAQRCLASVLNVKQGHLISVVLGSPRSDGHFQDTKVIFDALMSENQ